MSFSKIRKVWLNVYDLNATGGNEYITGINTFSEALGFGAFHSGVAVEGVGEWGYGYSEKGTGVFRCKIKECMPGRCKFRKTILLGETCKSAYMIFKTVEKMAKSSEWQGDNYDVTRRNCNHFSNALAIAIVGSEIPSWVNRTAKGLDKIRTGVEFTANTINAISNSETAKCVTGHANDFYSRNKGFLTEICVNVSCGVSNLYASCKQERPSLKDCELVSLAMDKSNCSRKASSGRGKNTSSISVSMDPCIE